MPASLTVDADISLSAVTPGDAERLFAMVEDNRAHLREWLPWLDHNTSVTDSATFITRSQLMAEQASGWNLMIVYAGRPSGMIGFNTLDAANRSGEIGYWLALHAVGHGVITRATHALIAFAFDHLNLQRITISVASANTRSRAVAERLGFVWEGTSRQAQWLYDHFVDLERYALLRPSARRDTSPATARHTE